MSRPVLQTQSLRLEVAAPALFSAVQTLVLFLLLFPAASLMAEEIYRCTLPDGSVVFQEQKCRKGKSRVLRGAGRSGAISARRLRAWLDDIPADKRPAAPAKNRSVPPALRSGVGTLPKRPGSEYLLSICSERILICTAEGLSSMDRCIANVAVCGTATTQDCCDQAFLQRYQLIRASGMVQREAVRGALLGVSGE